MKLTDELAVGVGLGLVAIGVVWFLANKAGSTAASIANAVNPFNQDNVFATSVNDLGAAVSGDKNWTLGGKIYDLTHPAFDPNAKTIPPEQVPSIDTPVLY